VYKYYLYHLRIYPAALYYRRKEGTPDGALPVEYQNVPVPEKKYSCLVVDANS
jgi:hypothetical protein